MYKISKIILGLERCVNTDYQEIEKLAKRALNILASYSKLVKDENENRLINEAISRAYTTYNNLKSNGNKSDKGSKSSLEMTLSSVSYVQVEDLGEGIS